MKRLLLENTSIVNIRIINSLMNAWAESSSIDAVDKAFDVLRLVQNVPECTVRPDRYTYGTLLKCLARARGFSRRDCGKRAVELLDEMQRLHDAGDQNMFPDVVAYTLAMRACLHANDTSRINEIMARMKSSKSTLPNLRSYSELLSYYSKLGTPEAAARCEAILSQLKQLSVSNPDLKPNVYIYTMAISAWLRSGFEAASNRAWNLLDRMKREGIEPSMVTNTAFVTHFCKSGEREDLERADFVVSCMESRSMVDLPNFGHYSAVIKGWLDLGQVAKANDVLMRCVKTFKKSQRGDCAPSAIVIDMVMQGWIREGNLNQALSLIQCFQELKDKSLIPAGPNLRSYSDLLEAWKASDQPERETAIRFIEEEMNTMKQVDRKYLFGQLAS